MALRTLLRIKFVATALKHTALIEPNGAVTTLGELPAGLQAMLMLAITAVREHVFGPHNQRPSEIEIIALDRDALACSLLTVGDSHLPIHTLDSRLYQKWNDFATWWRWYKKSHWQELVTDPRRSWFSCTSCGRLTEENPPPERCPDPACKSHAFWGVIHGTIDLEEAAQAPRSLAPAS